MRSTGFIAATTIAAVVGCSAPPSAATTALGPFTTVAGRTIPIEWNGSATAADLASLAPLPLSFSDYGGQEKLAQLPRALDLTGAPAASAAAPGDVGYYAPNKVLVLYYDAVGSYPGIVIVGRMSTADTATVRALPDDAAATLAVPGR